MAGPPPPSASKPPTPPLICQWPSIAARAHPAQRGVLIRLILGELTSLSYIQPPHPLPYPLHTIKPKERVYTRWCALLTTPCMSSWCGMRCTRAIWIWIGPLWRLGTTVMSHTRLCRTPHGRRPVMHATACITAAAHAYDTPRSRGARCMQCRAAHLKVVLDAAEPRARGRSLLLRLLRRHT